LSSLSDTSATQKTYNGKHKLEAHINKFWKFIANKQIMTQLKIAQLFLQALGEGEPLVGSHNFQDDSFSCVSFKNGDGLRGTKEPRGILTSWWTSILSKP
jgi:hypothetical protein